MMSHVLAVQLICCKSFADAYLPQMSDSAYPCLGCVQGIDESESESLILSCLSFVIAEVGRSIDIPVTPLSSIEVR